MISVRLSRACLQGVGLLGAILFFFACGESTAVKFIGEECTSADRCEAGGACYLGLCRESCQSSDDCDNAAHFCNEEGVCVPVPDPQCSGDADCDAPGLCRLAQGAECVAGVCDYPAAAEGSPCDDGNACTSDEQCDGAGTCLGQEKICDEPPEDACSSDDSFFVTYSDDGTCNPQNGECEYDRTEVACSHCRINCLMVCEGIECTDAQGGCRGGGHCDPFLEPPACVYDTMAPDGESCILPGDEDEALGVCAEGFCVECLSAQDCDNPPGEGEAICFEALACTDHACVYELHAERVCLDRACVDGVLRNERVCGPEGLCPSAGETDCQGFSCNAEGTACLDRCDDDQDCLATHYCDDDQACTLKLDLGQVCDSALGDHQCASGHCDNGFCCAEGHCCAEDADCLAYDSQACTDAEMCQGERIVHRCTPDFQCLADTQDDDSVCEGVFVASCLPYRDAVCSDAVEQEAPVCLSDCETAGAADGDKCYPGYLCEEQDGAFVCVPPAGLGDCCQHPADCPGLPCAGDFVCGNSQTPAVYVCCDEGFICCLSDEDCDAGQRSGYRCDVGDYRCFDDCAEDDDGKCMDDHHCYNDECVPDSGVGERCDLEGDCQTGLHCENGVCCAEGEVCCTLDTQCGACYKCGAASSCVEQIDQDLKDDCNPLLSCTDYVWGWNGSSCLAFSNPGSQYGLCKGGGQCYTIEDNSTADFCFGMGPAIASCGDSGCVDAGACVRDSLRLENDTGEEICHTSGHQGCSTCYACDATGDCVAQTATGAAAQGMGCTTSIDSGCQYCFDGSCLYYEDGLQHLCEVGETCVAGGECYEPEVCGHTGWTRLSSVAHFSTWYAVLLSLPGSVDAFYSDDCSGGSVGCNELWLVSYGCSAACGVAESLTQVYPGSYHYLNDGRCDSAGSTNPLAGFRCTATCGCSLDNLSRPFADLSHCNYYHLAK